MRRHWIRRFALAVVLLATFYAGLRSLARPAPPHAFFAGLPGGTLNFAHQGGDQLWPGNTLLAFEQAAALGVDVLELDVHATADGAIVVIHDETVDRTTDGTGLIKEMTLDQLRRLDAAYRWSADDGRTFPFRGHGLTIPTLAEVLAAVPEARLNVELKQAEPSIAAPVCDLIRRHGLEARVLVASFHEQAMREFRQACPAVATAATQNEMIVFVALNYLFLADLYSPPFQAAQVPEERFNLPVVTASFVAAAHRRNVQVHVWTINETADMQRLLALGVDGIMTKRPDRLAGLLGR